MKILGVSSYHHDSAAASLKDGYIQGAAHEERFTRKKYDNSFPTNTIEWLRNTYDCLLYTSPSPRDKRQSRMPSSA